MKISQKVLATRLSYPSEQPQGCNAPSSLPVRKTISTSVLWADFDDGFFGDLDIASKQEVLTTTIKMQVTNRIICQGTPFRDFLRNGNPRLVLTSFFCIEPATGNFQFLAAFYIHIKHIRENLCFTFSSRRRYLQLKLIAIVNLLLTQNLYNTFFR